MKTLNIAEAPVFPGTEGFDARMLKDNDVFGMVHFTLPPGGMIPQHNMPFEVCFVVLSGKGTLTINDDTFNLHKDYRAVCPATHRRGWHNYSTDEDLKVLVIKIKQDTGESSALDSSIPAVFNIFSGEPAKNPHGVDVRRVYESKEALSSIVTLEPGESLLRHITPVDAYFFLITGEGTVEIGEEVETVTADTLVDSPKDILHCWYNRSNEQLRFLVLKIPKPTTPTRFV